MITIRAKVAEDIASIHRINSQAFSRAMKADLVEALRTNGKVICSFVVVIEQNMSGHVLFTPITIIHNERRCNGVAVAPVLTPLIDTHHLDILHH